MPSDRITPEDWELAARALRVLADRCRADAAAQTNPSMRDLFEHQAATCERLAERFARMAKG